MEISRWIPLWIMFTVRLCNTGTPSGLTETKKKLFASALNGSSVIYLSILIYLSVHLSIYPSSICLPISLSTEDCLSYLKRLRRLQALATLKAMKLQVFLYEQISVPLPFNNGAFEPKWQNTHLPLWSISFWNVLLSPSWKYEHFSGSHLAVTLLTGWGWYLNFCYQISMLLLVSVECNLALSCKALNYFTSCIFDHIYSHQFPSEEHPSWQRRPEKIQIEKLWEGHCLF